MCLLCIFFIFHCCFGPCDLEFEIYASNDKKTHKIDLISCKAGWLSLGAFLMTFDSNFESFSLCINSTARASPLFFFFIKKYYWKIVCQEVDGKKNDKQNNENGKKINEESEFKNKLVRSERRITFFKKKNECDDIRCFYDFCNWFYVLSHIHIIKNALTHYYVNCRRYFKIVLLQMFKWIIFVFNFNFILFIYLCCGVVVFFSTIFFLN